MKTRYIYLFLAIFLLSCGKKSSNPLDDGESPLDPNNQPPLISNAKLHKVGLKQNQKTRLVFDQSLVYQASAEISDKEGHEIKDAGLNLEEGFGTGEVKDLNPPRPGLNEYELTPNATGQYKLTFFAQDVLNAVGESTFEVDFVKNNPPTPAMKVTLTDPTPDPQGQFGFEVDLSGAKDLDNSFDPNNDISKAELYIEGQAVEVSNYKVPVNHKVGGYSVIHFKALFYDNLGAVDSVEVEFNNNRPQGSLVIEPRKAKEGQLVTFNMSGSYTPKDGVRIREYAVSRWDEESQVWESIVKTSIEEYQRDVHWPIGINRFRLIVEDTDGNPSVSVYDSLQVLNDDPVVSFGVDFIVNPDPKKDYEVAKVTRNTSSDVNVGDNISFSWSYRPLDGSANWVYANVTTATPTITGIPGGDYWLRCEGRDLYGGYDADSLEISVWGIPKPKWVHLDGGKSLIITNQSEIEIVPTGSTKGHRSEGIESMTIFYPVWDKDAKEVVEVEETLNELDVVDYFVHLPYDVTYRFGMQYQTIEGYLTDRVDVMVQMVGSAPDSVSFVGRLQLGGGCNAFVYIIQKSSFFDVDLPFDSHTLDWEYRCGIQPQHHNKLTPRIDVCETKWEVGFQVTDKIGLSNIRRIYANGHPACSGGSIVSVQDVDLETVIEDLKSGKIKSYKLEGVNPKKIH